MKSNISHIGQIGEYTAFDDSAVKVGTKFGVFHKSTSGTLIGKEIATFKMKTSSKATKFPKAEAKMAEWAKANNLNPADYKVMPISFKY